MADSLLYECDNNQRTKNDDASMVGWGEGQHHGGRFGGCGASRGEERAISGPRVFAAVTNHASPSLRRVHPLRYPPYQSLAERSRNNTIVIFYPFCLFNAKEMVCCVLISCLPLSLFISSNIVSNNQTSPRAFSSLLHQNGEDMTPLLFVHCERTTHPTPLLGQQRRYFPDKVRLHSSISSQRSQLFQ